MFLSKRSNGIYYLWLEDELGKPRKVSTGCNLKSEALKFLQEFKPKDEGRKVRLQRTSLAQFSEDFLTHSKTNRAASTQAALSIALRVLQQYVGDIPLHKIGVREVESFLSMKKGECSDYAVRFYYIALASAFETAKRWNCIPTNPFR